MHYLTLPGELRNEIYHALLNSSDATQQQQYPQKHRTQHQHQNQQQQTLRLSKAGTLIAPTLAHTNNLIRRELCSLLEHRTSTASVIEAQAFDFNTAPLQAFLHKHPTKNQITVKLTLHLTSPGAEKAHYAALRAFLSEAQAKGWSVGYRVKFDWACYGIGEAAECARSFVRNCLPSGVVVAGSPGEGLWRALKKAREAEVRRTLVERPSRQRALMAEGRGRLGLME
jgi:hypothetical protein